MNTYIPTDDEFFDICLLADEQLADIVRLENFEHLIEVPTKVLDVASFFYITLNDKSYLPVIKKEHTAAGRQVIGMSRNRHLEFNDYNFFKFYVDTWLRKK